MGESKEFVEIELTDYFGHKHKKKIYDTKIYFYTEGPCIVYHKDGWNVGKPVWFNENDIEQLHKLKAGYIELLDDGKYEMVRTYKPIITPIITWLPIIFLFLLAIPITFVLLLLLLLLYLLFLLVKIFSFFMEALVEVFF